MAILLIITLFLPLSLENSDNPSQKSHTCSQLKDMHNIECQIFNYPIQNISTINDKIFVKKLTLMNTNIESVPAKIFKEFINLDWLNVSNCKVKDAVLNGNCHLTILDMSHNLVNQLRSQTFIKCKKILGIDLSHNLIDTIYPDAFQSNTRLKWLHLSYNQIANWEPNHMLQLYSIRLDHNLLTNYKTIAKNTPNLQYVDYSCNPIMYDESDDCNGFANLPNLKIVNLTSVNLNNAGAICFESLCKLSKLQIVIISQIIGQPDCENIKFVIGGEQSISPDSINTTDVNILSSNSTAEHEQSNGTFTPNKDDDANSNITPNTDDGNASISYSLDDQIEAAETSTHYIYLSGAVLLIIFILIYYVCRLK